MNERFKILFLLPLWDKKLQWGKFRRGSGNNNFNYGLASIAGVLKNAGYTVSVFDPSLHNFDDEKLKNFLKEYNPNLIGITCYTPTVVEVYHTAKLCKEVLPGCKIIVGGVHPSLYPEATLKECSDIDYVCIGEGEYLMPELVQSLASNGETETNINGIKGLAHRKEGVIAINQCRALIEDISKLPMPLYESFELEKYRIQPTVYKRLPTFTMVASRGCPYSCSFCQVQAVLGRRVRYRNVDKVIEEIEFLIDRYAAKGIMFHDGTFSINKKWVEDFCQALIKKRINITWMCLTRADCVDESLLKLMKRAGCFGMSFGVESFNQKTLDLMKKNLTVGQNIKALNMALDMNFFVTATYIICFPGEVEKDVLHTIETAKKIATHIAHFFYPLPYPETDLWRICKQDGGLREDLDWKYYSMTYDDDPIYINPRIGKERQKWLREYALRSYYCQPRVIWRNLKTINSLTDIKKYFKAGLALSGYWI